MDGTATGSYNTCMVASMSTSSSILSPFRVLSPQSCERLNTPRLGIKKNSIDIIGLSKKNIPIVDYQYQSMGERKKSSAYHYPSIGSSRLFSIISKKVLLFDIGRPERIRTRHLGLWKLCIRERWLRVFRCLIFRGLMDNDKDCAMCGTYVDYIYSSLAQ